MANGPIRPLWLVEKEVIEQAIASCDGNIPKAAALLEISPSTIYRKKQGFGMPIGRWLAEGALSFGAPSSVEAGLNAAVIADALREHRAGRADHRLFLWNLWVLRGMNLGGGRLEN